MREEPVKEGGREGEGNINVLKVYRWRFARCCCCVRCFYFLSFFFFRFLFPFCGGEVRFGSAVVLFSRVLLLWFRIFTCFFYSHHTENKSALGGVPVSVWPASSVSSHVIILFSYFSL